jgi:hypothetical protein
MRLHTNTLTATEISGALIRSGIPCHLRTLAPGYGSRSHARAFEIRLAADAAAPARDADGKVRRHNMDGYPGKGATYAEWGAFLAKLFAADLAAKIGPYDSAADFNRKTRYVFDTCIHTGRRECGASC